MKADIDDTPIAKHIVGIAASAGGLEAASLLVHSLPTKQDCCYVLAQHMSPSHKSMLVQLIARETELQVVELDQTTIPTVNTIYIPPPGSDVVLEDGKFLLCEPSGHPATPKPSADRLFKSLAEQIESFAVGIVLSGTGSDGTYGIRAIREAGGITVAQAPDSCKYDSMPQSAIRSGCVDLVLTPRQIGLHLEQVLERTKVMSDAPDLSENDVREKDLFQILMAHTLVDFRNYKESTIDRRIRRRMIAKDIDDFEEYVEYCRRSVEEVEALFRDMLISVTQFFRDPAQFEGLAKVLADKYRGHSGAKPARVWVPGCATGEEAYTLAIILAEALGGLDNLDQDAIQIFATDIDENALALARKGVYPSTAMLDIPEEYIDKYFTVGKNRITVKSKLRGFVMFSRHNAFQDAPFISVDLVSIRNVLIYFNAKLQERVLTRILYALNTGGLLFLGTSETTGAMENSFVQVDNTIRLYRKRNRAQVPQTNPLAFSAATSLMPTASDLPRGDTRVVEESWGRFDALARSIVTDGIMTNRDNSVLKVYGDIAPFAEITAAISGGMKLSVLRKPLATEAASLVLVCLKYGEARSGQWQSVEGQGFNSVQMTAYPVRATDPGDEDLVLIGFARQLQLDHVPDQSDKGAYVEHLEDELSRMRDALQVTIEQLQTSNEELQSVNEELQSTNEELQTTNEEIETSNEELQSTNEELITVNEELLVNSAQLERTSAELSGLIHSLPLTMLMLDHSLLVRYASDVAIDLFDIKERGENYGHLSQCAVPEDFPPLVSICADVIVDRKIARVSFGAGEAAQRLSVVPIESDTDSLVGLIVLLHPMSVQERVKTG